MNSFFHLSPAIAFASIALLATSPAQAQPTTITTLVPTTIDVDGVDPTTGQPLPADPRFDLSFLGGPVREFVEAVGEALGRPINVILNQELEDTEIPPMKLRQVTVPALFEAVASASRKEMVRESSYPGLPGAAVPSNYGGVRFAYSHGFRCTDRVPRTDSVWVFYRDGVPESLPVRSSRPETPQEVRVLNLTSYLEGRTVEDITTAIRTACDMLDGDPSPKLTYHKETNLLMSRGTPAQLEIVQQVLRELAAAPPPAGRNKSAQFQMSPDMMRRYGLMPATPPILPPTTEAAPK